LVQQLSATRLLKIAELRHLGQTNPQAKGANLAQVYGRVVCDRPLVSELSRQPCVYYKSEISWEYDEIECYRRYLNSQGDVAYSERISEGEYQNALRLGSRAKSYAGEMVGKNLTPVLFRKGLIPTTLILFHKSPTLATPVPVLSRKSLVTPTTPSSLALQAILKNRRFPK
jgi:hypothetical protein